MKYFTQNDVKQKHLLCGRSGYKNHLVFSFREHVLCPSFLIRFSSTADALQCGESDGVESSVF